MGVKSWGDRPSMILRAPPVKDTHRINWADINDTHTKCIRWALQIIELQSHLRRPICEGSLINDSFFDTSETN